MSYIYISRPRKGLIKGSEIMTWSPDIEQALISAALIAGKDRLKGLDIVANDFYKEEHRYLWRAIKSLLEEDLAIDVLTISDRLRVAGKLQAVGGITYLSELSRIAATSANIDYYVDLVKRKSITRQGQNLGKALDLKLRQSSKPGDTLIQASRDLTSLASQLDVRAGTPIVEALDQWWNGYETGAHALPGLQLGFRQLDAHLGGLQTGDLHIVAGRPGMGKSAFATQILLNAAKRGKRGLLCSLEMSKHQVITRLLAQESHMDSRALRAGKVSPQLKPRLLKAKELLSSLPIHIEDNSGHTPITLLRAASKLKQAHGSLDLVVVDYIGLMSAPGFRAYDRTAAISWLSRELRKLASQLSCCVVILAQLNREVEKRDSKRPQMSDLRQSGQLEADSSTVMLLFRKRYYNENEQEVRLSMPPLSCDVVELIVAKNRWGSTGSHRLAMHMPSTSLHAIDI